MTTDTNTGDKGTGAGTAQAGAGFDMPLGEAMRTQRAVRRLHPDPVDRDLVLDCIELALKAPTGSNAQNWEFVVVDDKDRLAQIARLYRTAWQLYGGIGRRVARGDDKQQRLLDAVQWQVDNFEDLPMVVVPCLRDTLPIPLVPRPVLAETSFYGSAYPSVQNFLLACRSVGLGACLITLPLWNVRRMRKILDLPWRVRPVCLIPVGHPKGRYGPTTRRPVEEVVHLNSYGTRIR